MELVTNSLKSLRKLVENGVRTFIQNSLDLSKLEFKTRVVEWFRHNGYVRTCDGRQ